MGYPKEAVYLGWRMIENQAGVNPHANPDKVEIWDDFMFNREL
jgi:hypothetical protein